MSISFNADEIFEMAEEIERNGARFYRKAAETADGDTKKMFLDFAVMEDGHEATFAAIRKELNESESMQTSFDPDGEAALYLQSMADAYGSEGKVSVDESLTGCESCEEIVTIAIGAEKDSVAFYVGLKDIVPDRLGKDKVDGIIKEELAHITTLNNKLASLR